MFYVKKKRSLKSADKKERQEEEEKLWTVRKLGRRKESWEKKALLTAKNTLAGASYLSWQNSFVGGTQFRSYSVRCKV